MPCCGKSRTYVTSTAFSRPAPQSTPAPLPRPQPQSSPAPLFEYVGKTGMTVVGPVTGLRYRFGGPGARVRVDPRDKPGLAAVPHLRVVQP